MAQRGGITPSGRFLRFVFWRAPMAATKYTVAGYMATFQDVGRRWGALAGFGLWVYGIWWLAGQSGSVGFQQVAAFLLLVWFWRLFAVVRWTYKLRVEAARARAIRRRELQLLEQLGGRVQQWGQAIPNAAGGVFTMMGSARHHDPVRAEAERIAREQADEVRTWLPDEHRDLPLGDRFEPTFRLPRFRRRKKGSDDA
jgi:hypothetical protein